MNLLVTGAFSWTEDELDVLKELGHNVVFMQNERDELPCPAQWVEGVICNGLFLGHSIEQFSALTYIQLISAGFDRVPMDYVKAHGIQIFNAGGVYSIPMAEFAVSGVLDIYKQKRYFYQNQQSRLWEKHRGLQELYGKSVCIVGCGNVGTECAKRFNAFGCQVTGVDIMPYESKFYGHISDMNGLEKAMATSDIVILTLPLTNETKGLINKKLLDKLTGGAIIVNIARGAIVDRKALEEALKDNRISAVLDVFEAEPLEEDSCLWGMENVIITPHNCFVGEGNHKRMWNVILDNLSAKGV